MRALFVILFALGAASPAAAQPIGACCSPTGICIETTREICEAGGRLYLGDGTTCDPNPCDVPFGACCFPDTTCTEMDMAACAAAGGVFQGDGSACGSVTCPPLGACCLFGDLCSIAEMADCIDGDGDWQGAGTTCSPDPCTATSAPGSRPGAGVLIRGPFPNPTTGAVRWALELPAPGPVRVRIVDVRGRVVAEPARSGLPAGVWPMGWSAVTADGREMPAGLYFLHVEAGGLSETRKIVLAR